MELVNHQPHITVSHLTMAFDSFVLMIGLEEPAQGEIFYGDESFTKADPARRQEMVRRMGVLFQSGALWSSMTLAENVGLPLGEFTDLHLAEIHEIAFLKLALVGLKGFEDYYPSETLPCLAYEQLDVMKMELPPGWRGYGAKDYIDHPDTPKRIAEIEKLKKKLNGADRFKVQETVMPYEQLLPQHFRGKNERIDEMMEDAR